MKKIILLLTSLILTTMTGCNSHQNNRVLEETYIQMAEILEKDKTISKEYRKKLLDEYELIDKKQGVNEDTGSEYTMYTYGNDIERLVVSDIKYDDEKATELYYERNKGADGVALGYTSYDKLEKSNEAALVSVSVSDSNLYKKIYKILSEENTELDNIYNQISTKVDTKNGISIDDVITLAGEEPSSKVVNSTQISEKLTCYYFNNEKELLEVYTIKGKDEVIRVYYDRSDKLLIKDTLQEKLLENENIDYASSITTYVSDISTQKRIIKEVG